MISRRSILGVAAIVAGALLSFLYLRSDLRPSQPAEAGTVGQLQQELDELRTELRRRPAATIGRPLATSDAASVARSEARAEAQRAIAEASTEEVAPGP